MLVCIYHIIKQKKPFNPTDYMDLMSLNNHKEKVIFNHENVFNYLQEHGYDTSHLIKNRNDS